MKHPLFQISSIGPYIAETSHASIRGSLVILSSFFTAFGISFVWIIGYFLNWRSTAFILIIPPILMTLFIILFPETPYWLIENNDYNGAIKSLQFFRGKTYNSIKEELDEIREKHESKLQDAEKFTWKFQVQRIFSMAFLKPFIQAGVPYFLTTWSGFEILQTYMITVLQEAGSNIWIDLSVAPTIVGIIGFITAGIAWFIKTIKVRSK